MSLIVSKVCGSFGRSARVIVAALVVSFLAPDAWAQAGKTSPPAKLTLEQLDSAANLLMSVSDGDKPGVCGITPTEGKKLLLAIQPKLDEKIKAAIKPLAARPAGKAIANPQWDETCLRNCHCGLYSSILEGVGELRLNPDDRAAFDRMSAKARVMTREHLAVCARKSSWFCASPLLSQLREEAKSIPDPAKPAKRARSNRR